MVTAVHSQGWVEETESEKKTRLRRVAGATVIGSMLEWYDFYLYAAMASIVFSRVFFDASDESAMLKSFATFTIGFLARPVGGIFFGYYGDRFGRKKMLVVTFLLMGGCTVLIGLIPTYASIGIWASVLLITARIFQGFAAGAELAGAVVTSYEHADGKKRGSQSAWPALGLNLGLLLSSLTIYLLTLAGDEFLLAGGWRIPFILSFVLIFVGLWVRKRLPETPEFSRLQKETKKPAVSFKAFFKNNSKGLLVAFFVAGAYCALSYTFKTFSLAYLTQFKGTSANVTSLAITLASLIAIIVVPISGWLCDKWSSKTMIAVGGVLSTLFAYPFMRLLETGDTMMICIAIGVATGILAPMMFAPQGSFISRQFPTEVRATGFAAGREVGTALAGGFAPLWALAMVTNSPTHSVTGVTILLMVSGLIVVASVFFDQGKKYSHHKN